MRKQKLILLVGLPASGKSVYAKEYLRTHDNTVVVSTDRIHSDIKELGIQIKSAEDIFREIKHRVRKSLLFGKNVIVNATNLKIEYRESFIKMARKVNKDISIEAHVIVADFDDCVERDAKREKSLGIDFLKKQMGTFQIPVMEEGYSAIEYYYTSSEDNNLEDINIKDIVLLLRSGVYKKMNCDSLGQALSILMEETKAPEYVVKAAYLSLLGRAITSGQDYAQCGAYLLLCQLLKVKKLSQKNLQTVRNTWLNIIKLINYSTLPLNFSKKHEKLFGGDFILHIKLISGRLRCINNVEKIKAIFKEYYGDKE
ncbi:MAG: ATP-binding protein [Clostridia bacterium]|nr:ATP-binding protein [Clostridia bacterium]